MRVVIGVRVAAAFGQWGEDDHADRAVARTSTLVPYDEDRAVVAVRL